MFRILVAKICISICLVLYAYCVYENQFVLEGFKMRSMENIDYYLKENKSLNNFLGKILPHTILFMFISSSFMIVTKSVLPKFIALLGFIGFNFFNSKPNYRLFMEIQTLQENIFIFAGILYLMTVDKKTKKKFLLNERQFQELTHKKHL